jgi:hypothetical protein
MKLDTYNIQLNLGPLCNHFMDTADAGLMVSCHEIRISEPSSRLKLFHTILRKVDASQELVAF